MRTLITYAVALLSPALVWADAFSNFYFDFYRTPSVAKSEHETPNGQIVSRSVGRSTAAISVSGDMFVQTYEMTFEPGGESFAITYKWTSEENGTFRLEASGPRGIALTGILTILENDSFTIEVRDLKNGTYTVSEGSLRNGSELIAADKTYHSNGSMILVSNHVVSKDLKD